GELLSLAASAEFERGLSMHRTKDEFAAVLKKMVEPEKLVHPANVPTPRDARVSPPVAKESTVTPASKSLKLSANVDLTASVVASEHNEEMVSAEVDGVGGCRVGRVSFGPNDVVVALSAGEKGDGLTPSSIAGEEVAVNPSGV
ncbi:hypothetical protein Tco_0435901, partial [Tanacetum coccineum]